eukprot:g8400.t1
MLVEGDFEKASRAAAEKKRRRPRAVPDASALGGGWTAAGRSSAPSFWPRYLDICLVATGVRCAALLDSRCAPRGSPPLAEVLQAGRFFLDRIHRPHEQLGRGRGRNRDTRSRSRSSGGRAEFRADKGTRYDVNTDETWWLSKEGHNLKSTDWISVTEVQFLVE